MAVETDKGVLKFKRVTDRTGVYDVFRNDELLGRVEEMERTKKFPISRGGSKISKVYRWSYSLIGSTLHNETWATRDRAAYELAKRIDGRGVQ